MRFRDKVVWITGASSGIGEALVRAFHAEGANVVLSARRAAELDRVCGSCSGGRGDLMTLTLDVADAPALQPAVSEVMDRLGRVDILINNAGVAQRALITDTEMATYRQLMEVNFFGAVALTKLVLPAMIDRGAGHIVAVTSVAGKYSTPYRSGYNASKFAMHGFFDSLRAELAPEDIPVTLIVPGAIRTNVSANALRGDGSFYGRVDRIFQEGMAVEKCAARILDAIEHKKDEVMIASGEAQNLVWLKRFLPALAARRIQLRKRP